MSAVPSGSDGARLWMQAARWSAFVDEVHETPTSLIGYGRRGATPIVLKLVKCEGDEWHSGRVLEAFAGRGVVTVLAHDPGAILLERLTPGESLVSVSRIDDSAATDILASVVAAMKPGPAPDGCPTVGEWGEGFGRYLASGDTLISRSLVERARETWLELCNSQREVRLLHGDLQHSNVLRDDRRGWLAIDPKGVVGEREFELGAILRNPVGDSDLFTDASVVRRRVNQLTMALQLDPDRVVRWAFAQAVLSAIWSWEDGEPHDAWAPVLVLADVLRTLPTDE